MKKPWQMSRKEWLQKGSSDLGIKWVFKQRAKGPPPWEDTLKAEKQAIKDFLGLFEDVMESLKEGGMTYRTLPARQKDFAVRKWWHQHLSHLYNPKEGMEDAREAIIVGRKLGFPDEDILYYVVRNYVLKAYEN